MLQIFSLSIHDYCTKMEQLFGKDMVEHEEIAAPPQAPASQKAWMEKAKAAMASFQGEKKIQPFFNFVPEVSRAFCTRQTQAWVACGSS
jgi:hypothetical protein